MYSFSCFSEPLPAPVDSWAQGCVPVKSISCTESISDSGPHDLCPER